MSRTKIGQKIEQGFSLSPQQLIKANILQLNSIMLETRLYQELESNPALEIIDNDPNTEIDITEDINDKETTDFEDEENQNWTANPNNNDLDVTLNLKNQSTISEQVISALRDDNLSDKEINIAEQIICNLDEQGYLKIDSELIADKLQTASSSVLEVIVRL